MVPDCIIWMGLTPDAPWSFVFSNGEFIFAENAQHKRDALSKPCDMRCMVIAGQYVRMLPHELPKLSPKESLKAASFVIEDDIAGPLSEQHIVLGAKNDARIAIVKKSDMERITEIMAEFGLTDIPIYADFDILSRAQQALGLADRIIHAAPLGYTLDTPWHGLKWHDLADHDLNTPIKRIETVQTLLDYVDVSQAINLRQKGFAPRKALVFSAVNIPMHSLKPLAAISALCVVSWFTAQIATSRSLSAKAIYIQEQTAQIYSQLTGRAAPPNPAAAALRQMQAGPERKAGFLGLSNILFGASRDMQGVTVEMVQYDNARDELVLRLAYPDFSSTADVERAVNDAGGIFIAGGVREQSGRYIGDATLSKAE